MQVESEPEIEFSERTEVLARKIGVGISDLPPKIGVANSSFHAYRSGKLPISKKTWRKLAAAEAAAGILDVNEESSADPKDSVISEATQRGLGEMLRASTDDASMRQFLESLAARVDRLEALFAQISTAVVSAMEDPEDRGASTKRLRAIPETHGERTADS